MRGAKCSSGQPFGHQPVEPQRIVTPDRIVAMPDVEIIVIAVEVVLECRGADHCEKPSAVLFDEGHLRSPNAMPHNVPMTLNLEVRKVTGQIYRYLTICYERNLSALEGIG
jgi:hypothetical protein